MVFRIGWLVMIVVVALTAGAARAADGRRRTPATAPAEADLQLAAWSKFEVGASVTHAMVVRAGDTVVNTETVTRLVEKAADRVVVESTVTLLAGAVRRARPAKQSTIRAKGGIARQVADERVEAAGETFDCKVYVLKETPADLPPAAKAEVKLWFNDKVPGGMVQLETTTPTASSKSTLTSYAAK